MSLGESHVRRLERLAVRGADVAVQDADEVDDRVLAGDEPVHDRFVVDVGLDDVDRRQQHQPLRRFTAPGGDGHGASVRDECRREMAADEAAAADDEDVLMPHVLARSGSLASS